MTAFKQERRNKVQRMPARGQYERDEVYQIVDDALICHVGFVVDGQPFVIPTLHARDGDAILLHGSSASRMMKYASAGGSLCITMTHVDGIVLARSIFNHSINYRSAVIFGQGTPITGTEEKMAALARFTERLLPGRWDDAREPNRQELKATAIVAVPIDSASAKVRSGPPKDDEEDLDLPVWAGVVPIAQYLGAPIQDAPGEDIPALPDYLRDYLETRAR